jgi:hypothetical protein
VGLGVALEALSLVNYSMLTRSVLPDRRPTFLWLLRTDLVGLGVSHLVPGGAVTASTLRYRLLHDSGVPPEDAVVGAAVEGIGSALILITILWVSLILSIPFAGFHPIYIAAAVVGATVIALVMVVLWAMSPSRGRSEAITRHLASWLPTRFHRHIERALNKAAAQLAQLLSDKHALRHSAIWASGNWLFDAAALWVFLAAYGWHTNLVELPVAYGLANGLAVLPISPGGLGVIEGVLIPSRVGFGGPRAEVILGVVSWRPFEF